MVAPWTRRFRVEDWIGLWFASRGATCALYIGLSVHVRLSVVLLFFQSGLDSLVDTAISDILFISSWPLIETVCGGFHRTLIFVQPGQSCTKVGAIAVFPVLADVVDVNRGDHQCETVSQPSIQPDKVVRPMGS